MKPFIPSAILLIILSTVTFFSCEKVDRHNLQRTSKGGVHLGGSLHVANANLPKNYLPNQVNSALASEIGLQMHEGLLRLDAQTLEIVPGIAQSWTVDDAGTTYVFSLRRGVKFHDDPCFGNTNREVTAHDFAFSFQQLCSKNSTAFASTFYNRVKGANAYFDGETNQLEGVSAIDDYTLKIELLRPDPSFLYVLAQPSTAVIPEKAWNKYNTELKVGAGPFILAADDAHITMVRNSEYYQEDAFANRLPYIDTLVFKAIPTKEKQLAAFFNDEIDLVSGVYLDPVKQILEHHIADFSGSKPTYIMQRETASVAYESYCLYHAHIKNFKTNFMGYRDFSRVEIEQ